MECKDSGERKRNAKRTTDEAKKNTANNNEKRNVNGREDHKQFVKILKQTSDIR